MTERRGRRRRRRARRDGRRRDDASRGQHVSARPSRAGSRTTLGLIPAGTGNDLCRGIGLDPDDSVAAAAVIAAGHTRSIDLARVGAALRRRRAGHRLRRPGQPPGERDDLAAGLVALHARRAGRAPGVLARCAYRLTLDGEVRELEAMLVAVGNTASYGGGMRICPQRRPLRRPAGRDDHPPGRSGQAAAAAAADVLRQVRPGPVRRAAAGPRGAASRDPGWSASATARCSRPRPLDRDCVVPRALPVFVPRTPATVE